MEGDGEKGERRERGNKLRKRVIRRTEEERECKERQGRKEGGDGPGGERKERICITINK